MSHDFRVYIDESGDHTYKQLGDLSRRYLGLTAIVFHKNYYDDQVVPGLEDLKRVHFNYDPDKPPILTRSHVIHRKRWFGVLNDRAKDDAWRTDLVDFVRALQMQVFTVVIDKRGHITRFPDDPFDAYHYCLAVLLNRIRGYLGVAARDSTADIVAEARGKKEDGQLQSAYDAMRSRGSGEATGADYRLRFPEGELIILRKDLNIAGLQVSDLLAYGLKQEVVIRADKPIHGKISELTAELNDAVDSKINRWGRYLID